MRGEEVAILAPRRHDDVRHRQQQRGVGARADRDPFGVAPVRHIGAVGRDLDEAQPGGGGGTQVDLVRMPAGGTGGDQAVAQRQAAEAEHHLGVAGDRRPIRGAAEQHFIGAEDMRQQRLRRGVGIGVDLPGIAAAEAEEALQLAARMVEAPGRGPAIGAAEDAGRAVLGTDAARLLRHQPHRAVPGDGHEGVAAAQRAAPPAFQPALADMGPVHAAGGVNDVGHALDQAAGEGVAFEGPHADHAAIAHQAS